MLGACTSRGVQRVVVVGSRAAGAGLCRHASRPHTHWQSRFLGARHLSTAPPAATAGLADALNGLSTSHASLDSLAAKLTPQALDALENALARRAFQAAGGEGGRLAGREMGLADLNKDGVLSAAEFDLWFRSRALAKGLRHVKVRPTATAAAAAAAATDAAHASHHAPNDVAPSALASAAAAAAAAEAAAAQPSAAQLRRLFVRSGAPFLAFGFIDNSIMVLAGGVIEDSVGVMLGLSTLASAGLGNAFADGIGIGLGRYIEVAADKLGLPDPRLTAAQAASAAAKRTALASGVICIAIGCVLGLTPLLFRKDKGGDSDDK